FYYKAEIGDWLARIRGRHLAPLDHRGPSSNLLRPAHDMFIALCAQELGSTVGFVQHDGAVPGPYRDVRDGVVITTDVPALRQPAIQQIELTLDLHGEAVDGIFLLLRCINIEVTKSAADIGTGADLPEQPGETFVALRPCRQE